MFSLHPNDSISTKRKRFNMNYNNLNIVTCLYNAYALSPWATANPLCPCYNYYICYKVENTRICNVFYLVAALHLVITLK